MAVYVSPGRRRRRTIVAAVTALVVGIAIGVFLGRGTAGSIDDKVAATRSAAAAAAAGLSVLPLEYAQSFAGQGGGATADTVQQAGARVTTAVADTPWLPDLQRARVAAAVRAMTEAARRKAQPAQFDRAVGDVQNLVVQLFGVQIRGAIAPDGTP